MQRVEMRLEDDLTGGPADETLRFGVDGREYELDLNARHATEFRRQLAQFVEHARQVRPQRARGLARTAASRERSREIRAWAERQGFPVAEHGRLPADVIQEYDRAHGSREPAERAAPRSAGRRTAPARARAKPHGRAKASRQRRTGRLPAPPGEHGDPCLNRSLKPAASVEALCSAS
jgi:Lsr2